MNACDVLPHAARGRRERYSVVHHAPVDEVVSDTKTRLVDFSVTIGSHAPAARTWNATLPPYTHNAMAIILSHPGPNALLWDISISTGKNLYSDFPTALRLII